MASSLKMPPWTGYGLSTLGLWTYQHTLKGAHPSTVLVVDVQNTPSAAEALIPASKVDGTNAILAQHRGAHDAWFHRDIEVRLVQYGNGMLRQDARKSNELGVPRAIQGPVRLVHSSADDFAIFDEDTADGSLVTDQRKLSLLPNELCEGKEQNTAGSDSPLRWPRA